MRQIRERQSTTANLPRLWPAVLTCAALLAGCAAQPPTGSAGAVDTAALERRAAAQAESGNPSFAAELYAQLAAATTGTARSAHLIEAARQHVTAGNPASAVRLLEQARSSADAGQRQRIAAVTSEAELLQGDAGAALETLDSIPPPISVPLMREISATRGRALFALGRHEAAVRAFVEREVWLETAADIIANQQMIWSGLAAHPEDQPPSSTGERTIDGWLALGPIAAMADGDQAAFREALLRWQSTYPGHPATGALLAELFAGSRDSAEYPQQIALLLPISSAQQAAALAVRDGFLAAHLQGSTSSDVRVRIYDTGLLGSEEAYRRAQLDGAGFIVGPLLRNEVEQITAQAGVTPTLALNFLADSTTMPPGFFQFALAPEDEAREVARHAHASGARTAVALVPNTEWGLRLLASFRAEFEALGGELLEWSGYAPAEQDFSSPITRLLNIDESTQRYRRLAANLGTALQFEPRRRRDVDMLFVAADNAQTGRLLAPQLRFHYAGDIPTYATSAVHEPNRRSRDGDLNGLYFPDTPWVLASEPAATQLRRQLEGYWPERASRWVRLYGMGFDAFELIPYLYNHGANNQMPALAGMSGRLTLAADGKIHRRLPLARFQNGVPVLLDDQLAWAQQFELAQAE